MNDKINILLRVRTKLIQTNQIEYESLNMYAPTRLAIVESIRDIDFIIENRKK